ncbi:HIT domain-containing protein [Phenylobacterium sp. Root700]|uniref:HIT domain-containing protein n=1 Tax=Phenylobacterium sp. Root700 TaxID=1736591 RepID=UPI0006F9C65B|nr:HIT domain-containing protein [Phenylobacterium sp. Root700]KRB40698.1 diadenosine tetraphosphate hydrolase [Phenylobacterium sp. Root700]
MFDLDPAFVATSQALGDLALSHARLQDDARYPWIVLIPRVAAARELEDLSPADLAILTDEILAAGRAVRALGVQVDKLNVGALGNVTPQLHVHVLGRRVGDAAWPGPVWGHSPARPYGPEALTSAVAAARRALGL